LPIKNLSVELKAKKKKKKKGKTLKTPKEREGR
jgi:hypothetical protein